MKVKYNFSIDSDGQIDDDPSSDQKLAAGDESNKDVDEDLISCLFS